jgi:hypothetical protein
MRDVLLIVLALATYRATRFVITDTLIDTPRVWLHTVILGKQHRDWRAKIHELLTCHHCISVWFAAASVALADIWTSVPLPGLMWLAVAGGASVAWRLIEE